MGLEGCVGVFWSWGGLERGGKGEGGGVGLGGRVGSVFLMLSWGVGDLSVLISVWG